MNTAQNQTQIKTEMLNIKKISIEDGKKWISQCRRNVDFTMLWGIYQGDQLVAITHDPSELLS